MDDKCKKLGILTFHYTENPGSLLQAYALKAKLSEIFEHVEIINFKNSSKTAEIVKAQYLKKYKAMGLLRYHINKISKKLRGRKIVRECDAFREKYLGISSSDKCYDEKNIRSVNKEFSGFVAGSDQIWNIRNMRFSYAYMLDFADSDKKKLSYAPSLSESVAFSEDERQKVIALLSDFSLLSSREKSGCDFISDLTQKPCKNVLDPTLLHDAQFYEKIIVSESLIKGNYTFVYQRSNDSFITETVSNFNKNGFKTVYSPDVKIDFRNKNFVFDISPEKWLNLIKYSDRVITNSFHGVVFSIIFKKNFWVKTINGAATNSRILGLLRALGLEDRLFSEENPIELEKEIDYECVYEKLVSLRSESEKYLKEF